MVVSESELGPLERNCEEHLHVPVRIYALAKELKLDSKDLVDLCTRIGIPNKGSALASLEDDEAARIRKYLAGSGPGESSGGSASSAPSGRPTGPAIGAPIREPLTPPPVIKDISSPASSAPAAPAASAAPSAPSPAAARASTPPAAVEPPKSAPVEVPEPVPVAPVVVASAAAVREVEPESAARPSMSREDYIGPAAGAGGRVRVLGSRRSAPVSKPSDGDDRKKPAQPRREPVINLAKIPKGHQAPVAAPKSNEPAPQKPEFKLTKDLLTGHRQGMNAPLESAQAAASAWRRCRWSPRPG
jgi:translation initiation factor IF-2